MKNELDRRQDDKRKAFEEVQSWYTATYLSMDNGVIGYDGWMYVNPVYFWKSYTEIEEYAYRFAESLYDFELTYDLEFQTNHEIEVQRQLTFWGTREEIEHGMKEWVVEWTRDYMMSYYDVVNSLLWLSADTIWWGMKSVWWFVQNPVDSLASAFDSFLDSINSIYEKVATLNGYEGAKGTSYVGTNVALSSVDPTGKILTLAWGGFFAKIVGKVEDIIFGIKVSWFNRLENHFNNHWSEFWANTQEEYLALAITFAESKNSNILQKINKYNDSIVKYDPNTNTFLSININTKEIRTFFKPDTNDHIFETNLDYFNAQ